jgi:hypothetical protein
MQRGDLGAFSISLCRVAGVAEVVQALLLDPVERFAKHILQFGDPVPPPGADGEIAPKVASRNPHRELIQFVERGLSPDWDRAAKEVYGFGTVDDLESAWIEWLKKSTNLPKGNSAPIPRSKDEKPELIPPTKLPGVSEGKPFPMDFQTEGLNFGGQKFKY